MKVLMINSVCGIRSTGRICTDLATVLEAQGNEVKIAYGRENVPEKFKKYAVKIGNTIDVKIHGVLSRLFDMHGYGSKYATIKFIEWVEEYNPDIIHLHNIHGYYINLKILFDYLKKSNKPVIWSLYDCWSFTGHCAHFDFNQCDKWKNGCYDCKYIMEYPKSYLDGSKRNFRLKKNLFSSVDNLTIIAPSQWMKNMLLESFFQEKRVCVMPNGIDLKQFVPTNSSFRRDNDLDNKLIVLGVASTWDRMKGIDYINRLADELDKNKYQVMIVGNLKPEIQLSMNVLHIPRTNSIKELCEIYTVADIFVNPTLQETQGLTTIEALACGTPAVVFNSGGASECINGSCGESVDRGDYNKLKKYIIDFNESVASSQKCVDSVRKYDKSQVYLPFLKLYDEISRTGK